MSNDFNNNFCDVFGPPPLRVENPYQVKMPIIDHLEEEFMKSMNNVKNNMKVENGETVLGYFVGLEDDEGLIMVFGDYGYSTLFTLAPFNIDETFHDVEVAEELLSNIKSTEYIGLSYATVDMLRIMKVTVGNV